ncbi:MAG: HD domain-containing protein [Deltaproteobacteria bacterium]|nr:HD domain-containing protein [Deltaproteobacteria bacterium]
MTRRLQTWFESFVGRYRGSDGALCAPLELKYRHSLRVAANARTIAANLGLSPAQVRLAEGCGLLHDVGRFPQFAAHGSFRDADTVDHGVEGRRVLETEGVQRLVSPADWDAVAAAVEYHNRRTAELPEGLAPEPGLMLRVVRDADKLDVLELVLQSVARDGFRELPEMLPHIRLERTVSPEVLAEAAAARSVSLGNVSTLADFLVLLATWFHDLHHAPSRCLAFERELPGRLRRELPDTPEVRALFAGIERPAVGC